jgi:hypothetical protein
MEAQGSTPNERDTHMGSASSASRYLGGDTPRRRWMLVGALQEIDLKGKGEEVEREWKSQTCQQASE